LPNHKNNKALILNKQDLLQKIKLGKTSFVQFKERVKDTDSLEAEMVAFANAHGGSIVVGVADNGEITGLTKEEKENYVQLASNVSSQRINPPIGALINAFLVAEKLVLVIEVPEGDSKPYFSKNGVAWGKVGADKRKLGREELRRLFQASQDFYPDEMPIPQSSFQDVNLAYFSNYYFRLRGETMADSGFEPKVLLNRMGIMQGEHLNLAGLLFFGENPTEMRPTLQVKAVSFVGNDLAGTQYRDSVDMEGNVETQYRACMDFCKRNLRRVQNGQGFNSVGQLEISLVALEEALSNAFLHRDYTKNSPIRILLFDDRLEIISPGSLPNHLSIEQIQYGDTVIRNPRIVSFGTKILPYRGLGSGIARILKEHPRTEFINDRDGQQFKVVMWR
jgi:ATP-dependent DNA helicase RecG